MDMRARLLQVRWNGERNDTLVMRIQSERLIFQEGESGKRKARADAPHHVQVGLRLTVAGQPVAMRHSETSFSVSVIGALTIKVL